MQEIRPEKPRRKIEIPPPPKVEKKGPPPPPEAPIRKYEFASREEKEEALEKAWIDLEKGEIPRKIVEANINEILRTPVRRKLVIVNTEQYKEMERQLFEKYPDEKERLKKLEELDESTLVAGEEVKRGVAEYVVVPEDEPLEDLTSECIEEAEESRKEDIERLGSVLENVGELMKKGVLDVREANRIIAQNMAFGF